MALSHLRGHLGTPFSLHTAPALCAVVEASGPPEMGLHVARGGGVLEGPWPPQGFRGPAVGHCSLVTILRGQGAGAS